MFCYYLHCHMHVWFKTYLEPLLWVFKQTLNLWIPEMSLLRKKTEIWSEFPQKFTKSYKKNKYSHVSLSYSKFGFCVVRFLSWVESSLF